MPRFTWESRNDMNSETSLRRASQVELFARAWRALLQLVAGSLMVATSGALAGTQPELARRDRDDANFLRIKEKVAVRQPYRMYIFG